MRFLSIFVHFTFDLHTLLLDLSRSFESPVQPSSRLAGLSNLMSYLDFKRLSIYTTGESLKAVSCVGLRSDPIPPLSLASLQPDNETIYNYSSDRAHQITVNLSVMSVKQYFYSCFCSNVVDSVRSLAKAAR